ncbi:MAG: hypothetical protein WC661_09260 [Opitutaceae bacterium]
MVLAVWLGLEARAGSATNIGGLYYTGLNSSGGLQSGGGRDSNWDVTYAYVNGTRYRNSSTYTSSAGAYVLSSSYIDYAYVPNTSSAQWITAPGAMTAISGGTVNIGGDYLPGNGTTGSNMAIYVYQLAFTITGTGTGVVTNAISMSLTVAADDAYEIYVTANPVTLNSSGVVSAQYAASASGTNAWGNTTSQTLTNTGGGANTTFNIGTNYLTVVVHNTNSQTGDNGSTALNPSGLLMYQVGAVATIDGQPVPEVGTWLPLLGAVGLYGAFMWRRGRARRSILAS